MIKDKIQRQVSGDRSNQYQAQNDIVINQGNSYSEIKEIAMDVFRSNFFELAGHARDVADARASTITDTLLEKLAKVSSETRFGSDPDFQYSFFLVQREYARTGDDELGELLTDILVDRSKNTERNILRLVLNESILVASKLTSVQINILSLMQSLTGMDFKEENTIEGVEAKFKKIFQLTGDLHSVSEVNFIHLEYSGAISLNNIVERDIERHFYAQYELLLQKKSFEEFSNSLYRNYPNIFACIDAFMVGKMYRAQLTSVGTLIALANLRKSFPEIDYNNWIR